MLEGATGEYLRDCVVCGVRVSVRRLGVGRVCVWCACGVVCACACCVFSRLSMRTRVSGKFSRFGCVCACVEKFETKVQMPISILGLSSKL